MGNCLVTKLKSVINNNNLPVLGCIKVHVNASANDSRTMVLTGSSKAVIKNQDEGVYFTNSSKTANYGLEVTPENGYQTVSDQKYVVVAGTGACDIIIYDKYSMTSLSITPSMEINDCSYIGALNNTPIDLTIARNTNAIMADIDLGDIFEGTIFDTIILTNNSAYFNIKMLPYIKTNKSLITKVKINNTRVYNADMDIILQTSVEDLQFNNCLANDNAITSLKLGTLIHITNLITKFTTSSSAFGTVESFVATQRTNGRTTCDGITWKYAGWCGATFNGEAITQDENIRTLSWTDTTITFDGVTIDNSDVEP